MRLWLLLICTTIYAGCEQATETESQNLQSETQSAIESPAMKTAEEVPQTGLAGEWKIFHGKNDEHEHSVTLEKVDDTHYRLSPKSLAFQGLYEYDGTLLKMVDENGGYRDLTWQMTESNALVMIEGGYNGAVMGQNDFDPQHVRDHYKPINAIPSEWNGRWQITHGANAEHEHEVRIQAISETRHRLTPKGIVFSGVYDFVDGKLKMVDENPGYPDLVWQRKDSNTFEMIAGGYPSAVMTKIIIE